MMQKLEILLWLLFVFVIPLLVIHYWVYSAAKKADEEYKRKLEDIEKRYR